MSVRRRQSVIKKLRRRIKNIHPGDVLEEDFLKPLGMTHYRLAKAINVPQTRISEICHGRRSVTADTALRLARFFGTSPELWLGLQQGYDLEQVRLAGDSAISDIVPFNKAS